MSSWVVTLVIAEEYNAEQAFSLLRAGAADYLDRPLNLRRLAYLMDVLTIRARRLLRPSFVRCVIAMSSEERKLPRA